MIEQGERSENLFPQKQSVAMNNHHGSSGSPFTIAQNNDFTTAFFCIGIFCNL